MGETVTTEENTVEELITSRIANELGLSRKQTGDALKLLNEGNTVPFIARYRKEETGGLTDEQLRQLSDLVRLYRNLEETRESILRLLEQQGVLSDELKKQVKQASTVTELDDIYRPYRPKKKTRGTVAKSKGLEPLADEMKQGKNPFDTASFYLDEYTGEENGLKNIEDAVAGARDIVAEQLSDNPHLRKKIRHLSWREAELTAEKLEDSEETYRAYHEFSEPIKKIPSYRVLALNRGEKENCLKVAVAFPEEKIRSLVNSYYNTPEMDEDAADQIKKAVVDGLKRLLLPSLERELRQDLSSKAEERAISIFKSNLNRILLTPPMPGKTILGLDPAYRTGCKLACIDSTGRLLEVNLIYPIQPYHRKTEAASILKDIIERNGVDLMAIGNGTGSRETEEFVAQFLQDEGLDEQVQFSVVSEAGASVYSASRLAKNEFPDLDTAERSAVSIARRVLDPLAELVKIEPRSIGVGQYQHDVAQKQLQEALSQVVEDCVNRVGVDVNTASVALLENVAGVNKTLASNIVKYREENGSISSRKELHKVPRMGPAAFKQSAGFLRIPDGEIYLDRSAVHPESYELANQLLDHLGISLEEAGNTAVSEVELKNIAETLEAGEYTLRDILEEFKKPGRDPRENMPRPVFRKGVLHLEDLKEGMEMQGVVRNVVDFGAFIDIGVHYDGLLHISKMSHEFVKHPMEKVAVGDIIKVKVVNLDTERKRISLSLID